MPSNASLWVENVPSDLDATRSATMSLPETRLHGLPRQRMIANALVAHSSLSSDHMI